MKNQVTICVKLDAEIFDELEKETGAAGRKRNRIINDAVAHYLEYLDTLRKARAVGDNFTRSVYIADYTNAKFWRYV